MTNTWADGYGIWHARVPDTPDAERVARDYIRHELTERGEISPGVRLRVAPALPSCHNTVPGTVIYREV